MKTAAISVLATALSLGLITAAEAEEWTGYHLTFGLAGAATDLRSSTPAGPFEDGPVSDAAPYAAFGYDWAADGLTFGVLADVQLTEGMDHTIIGGKGIILHDSDWFATFRARVGMPLTEKLHGYASAGIAVMGAQSQLVMALGSTESKQLFGAAAGLGLEYSFSPGRHLTVEYLHADFDETEFHDTDIFMNPVVDTLRIGYTIRF